MKHRVKISIPRSPKPKREKNHIEAKDIDNSIVEKQEENEEDDLAKVLVK